jgi:GTP cyclohydrolase I
MTTRTYAPVATEADAEAGIAVLLRYLGYDPNTTGLMDTPARVVRSFLELTRGRYEDAGIHLSRVFAEHDGETHDELIACTGIPFTSLCEHHLLPFTGTATVAYIPAPGAPVVGLSKLARVVDVFARRLTIQERVTHQITDALTEHLETIGVAAVLTSQHSCLSLRGACKPGARMVTSSMQGVFRTDPCVRAELLALHAGGC